LLPKIKSIINKKRLHLSLMANDQFIIYQSNDGKISIDVKLEDENIWLSQSQMQELFDQTKQNISLHINNIFKKTNLPALQLSRNT
jgi:hypothetical protein